MSQAFDNLTLSQRVYKHLREEILSDRLPPGTELSEVALAKELEVSRGPIREAMGRLAAEGLIKVQPRRRAVVRSLTPQELIDAYEVREALEVLAVRLAVPRVAETDLARLEQLIDQMADHAKANAIGDFFAANVEFHETLCELSGNEKLQEVHHRLEGEIGRFKARTLALRGSLDGSLDEHRAILAAIRLRDVEKAAALTAAHVRVPAQRLQATLSESAHPEATEPGPGDAMPAGAVTADASDAMTGDAMTDDAMTADAVTDDAMTDDAMTGDAMTADAVTDDAMTGDAMPAGAVTGDALSADGMTGDAAAAVKAGSVG